MFRSLWAMSVISLVIFLSIESSAYTLSGNVVTPSGVPASYARIEIYRTGSRSDYIPSGTRAAGDYSVSVPEGSYDFYVYVPGPGYVQGLLGGGWNGYVLTNFSITGDTTKDLILPFATISGRTMDRYGTPVPGTQVSVNETTWENTVQDYWDLSTASSGSNGEFSFIYPAGSYPVVLRVLDRGWITASTYYNSVDLSTSQVRDFVVSPLLTASSLPSGTHTNNATLNIAGTVYDRDGSVDLKVQDTPVTTINGTFSTAVALKTGYNLIITVGTDTLGNKTADLRRITLDQTAPQITVSTPADNSITAQEFVHVYAYPDESATLNVKVNGQAAGSSDYGYAFDAWVELAPGMNTIDITATDYAGNTANTKRTVIFDNSIPSLTVTTPSQDLTTAQNTMTIAGTVDDSITAVKVTVAFNGQVNTPAVVKGAFSQQITFSTEGTFPIRVTATDAAGHTSSTVRNVIFVLPSDASCGAASGAPLSVAPKSCLCATGTASPVSGTGPWNWICSGSVTGAYVACSDGVRDVPPDGILNGVAGKTQPDVTDALRLLRIVVGIVSATSDDLTHGDIAPLSESGTPQGDGALDIGDAIGILRMAVGIKAQ